MENIPREKLPNEERPDHWWYRIYAAVIAVTVAVIASLWAFSEYFSNI